MAIIATRAEGHPDHGKIIDWDHVEWCAVKQYQDQKLAYVIFSLDPDHRPIEITSMGARSSALINNILCHNAYKGAVVVTEKIGDA